MSFRIAEAYVEVKADSDGLRGEVSRAVDEAGAGQEVKVKVNVDKSSGDLGGLFSNLAPLILPGVAAVGQLSGALGLVPAAAGLAIASVAALAIGTSGISSAIKDYTAAQNASGQTAAQSAAQQLSSANSILNAQASLKSAVQGVSDAQRTAASSIVTAQDNVKSAIQAVGDAQRSAATSIINAEHSVQSAIQGVADAQRSSADQIISAKEALTGAVQSEANAEQTASLNNQMALQAEQRAEEALQTAQESALRAQQNLTDARESAARSLEDLQNRVADTALAQRAAVEQLEKAQAALDAPAGKGQTKDMEALQLAVDQATQHLSEMGLASRRAQEDQAAAAAKGVDGSKQVVAAQDQVLSTQRALTNAATAYSDAQDKVTRTQLTGEEQVAAARQKIGDAQRALDNAQITGAERVAKAQDQVQSSQRALDDARVTGAERVATAQDRVVSSERALDNARITGAEQVAKAQDQVLAAQRGLAQAVSAATASTSAGATAWAKYNAELAKLAPNAQDFLRSVISLGPAYDALKLDVQQRLFAGLGAEVRQVGAADLPILRTGLDKMADSLNLMFRKVGDWATSSKTLADLRVILDNSAVAGRNLTGAVQPALDILRNVGAVGSEFLPALAQHFADAAKSASDFVSNARATGKLHEWIQTGIDSVRTLWAAFKDVFDIVKQVSEHQGPVNLLDVIKLITGGIRWLVDNVPDLIPVIELLVVAWKVNKIAQWVSVALKIPAILEAMAGGQTLLNAAMDANPIGLVILAITALVAVGVVLYTHWAQSKTFLLATWGSIRDTATSVWGAIGAFFTLIWNGIKNTATTVWLAISGFFSGAFNSYRAMFESVWNAISGIFTGVWNTIRNTATSVWNNTSSVLTGALNTFRGFFSGVWNGIVGDFSNIWGRVTGIAQNVWNAVVGAFHNGVNAVIGLINRLVDGADTVLGFLHIALVPHVPALADGGVLGLAGGGTVGKGFTTNGPMAIVGEGNPNHPEYVIPTDPAHRGNALSLYQSLGAKLLAGGGVIDWIGGVVSKVEKWTGAGALGVMNQAVDGLAGGIPAGMFRDVASGVGHQAVAAIKALIDGAQAAVAGAGSAFSAAFHGSPNLAGWIQQALGLTGTPGSWAGPLSVLIGRESGGNPNAINNWDSNAAAGHPSQGLMQTIPGTFNAYHQAGTSWNILDPVANIAAGINYIKARYGSIFNVQQANPNLPPKGYDAGGLLPTGLSLVRNSTGAPERVLNATQTAKLDRLLAGRGGGGSVTVNVTQVAGSPAETGRFVALALRTVG